MYFISLFVRITPKPVSEKISFFNIFTSNVSCVQHTIRPGSARRFLFNSLAVHSLILFEMAMLLNLLFQTVEIYNIQDK